MKLGSTDRHNIQIEREFYLPSLGPETIVFLSDTEVFIDYESKEDVSSRVNTGRMTTTREVISLDNPQRLLHD